jgi:hypothetical protein
LGIKVSTVMWDVMGGRSGPPDLGRLLQDIPRMTEQLTRTVVPLTLLVRVVLLLNMPFAFAAIIAAYETLFGSRPAARA